MTTNRSLLEEIREQTTETRVKMAKVEEHLKNLNGSVLRHEKSLEGNDNRLDFLERSMAKIFAIGSVIAIVFGVMGHFIGKGIIKLIGR